MTTTEQTTLTAQAMKEDALRDEAKRLREQQNAATEYGRLASRV